MSRRGPRSCPEGRNNPKKPRKSNRKNGESLSPKNNPSPNQQDPLSQEKWLAKTLGWELDSEGNLSPPSNLTDQGVVQKIISVL